MKDPTRYVLTMYNGGKKIGRATSQFRDTLEEHQRQWNQASETHTSVIETEEVLQNERIGEIDPDQYLTQASPSTI